MSLFPVLEIETLVQENDKTRLNAVKSFASGGSSITKIEIKPSALETALDITDAAYLDWAYPFEIDIVTGSNDKIDFKESGSELHATLAQGTYTLSGLAAEIQSKMRAAGALTYVVSVSSENKFTVSAGSLFSLLISTGANASKCPLSVLGMGAADLAGKATYTGDEVERIARTLTLTLTGDETPTPTTEAITKTIEVISERADRLFSTDDKLRSHESDVLTFVADGRSSYKDVHRRAQTLIMAWLDTEGYVDDYRDKLVVKRIRDTDEVSEWATMLALKLIFLGVHNAKDDVFISKAKYYEKQEAFYRGRAVLRIDLNKDGTADLSEVLDIRSARVMRR